MAMNSSDYLDAVQKGLQESVELLSSRDKFVLESYVVSEFLQNLSVSHASTELQPGGDPPDVEFRDAHFEVKEIMDEGRRRVPEYKQALARALAATDAAELLEDFTPKSITLAEVYALVLARASKLASLKYPPAVRGELDLLFYINLQDVMGLIEAPYPNVQGLANLGFRSVSFLDGHRSCIFCAAAYAPSFMSGHLGVVHRE
jgi:hypothetical protein